MGTPQLDSILRLSYKQLLLWLHFVDWRVATLSDTAADCKQVRMPHSVDETLQRLEFHRLPDFGPPPNLLKPLPAQHYAEFPRYAALQRLEVSPHTTL